MAELMRAVAAAEHPPRLIDVDADGLPTAPAGDAEVAATDAGDPALLIFTSGTAGEPRGVVHTQGYLRGQSVQAQHWLGPRPGELSWCTAASGWSKSARNAFVAPWTAGAACLLHDARFDPAERLALVAEQEVAVLCQSPTEYRMIAKRTSLTTWSPPALRHLVSAGEPLNPEVMRGLPRGDRAGHPRRLRPDGDGPADRHARRASRCDRARWAGRCPASTWTSWTRTDGPPTRASCALTRARCRRSSAATSASSRSRDARWRTGDRVRRDADGFLWFEGRLDDVILSAGYRIGPFEVESALIEHPAVAEAAAVAAPDAERGAVVEAVVVLRDGHVGDDAPCAGATGTRQAIHRSVQVPAHRAIRRRAAENGEREDQACRAASVERRFRDRPLGLTSCQGFQWRFNDNREHRHRSRRPRSTVAGSRS